MKNKTPLILMEQLIMVLVFALAASICLRVFVYSNNISKNNETLSNAAFEAQNLAEELKATKGESFESWQEENNTFYISFDENWQQTSENSTYLVTALKENAVEGICKYTITVTENNDLLFRIPVAWQEVAEHE